MIYRTVSYTFNITKAIKKYHTRKNKDLPTIKGVESLQYAVNPYFLRIQVFTLHNRANTNNILSYSSSFSAFNSVLENSVITKKIHGI